MASSGDPLKQVKDFKYLGSRMESTGRDIKEREAPAWRAFNNQIDLDHESFKGTQNLDL